jgi:hypothetical protein
MDRPRTDGDASLGEAQSSNPPDDPEMIEGDEPLDTDVEDADLYVGEDDEDDGPGDEAG